MRDTTLAQRGSSAVLRPMRWPDDVPALEALDTCFTTDRVYRVRRGALSFDLVEEPADPPIRKSDPLLRPDTERLRGLGHVVVAEADGALVGVAAADLSTWNRRVQVEHFYVAAPARKRGIGRALMGSVVAFAREAGARCVWLETQNVNYPAVKFYQRLGFRLCGLDARLYDPATLERDEIGIFFALDLTTRRAGALLNEVQQ